MNTFGQWGPSLTSLTSPEGLDPVKRRGHGQGTIQRAGERGWVQGCQSVADPEFPRGGGFPVNRMMHRYDWKHYLPATPNSSQSMIHGPQIADWANTLKAMCWWRNIECAWRRITGEPPYHWQTASHKRLTDVSLYLSLIRIVFVAITAFTVALNMDTIGSLFLDVSHIGLWSSALSGFSSGTLFCKIWQYCLN